MDVLAILVPELSAKLGDIGHMIGRRIGIATAAIIVTVTTTWSAIVTWRMSRFVDPDGDIRARRVTVVNEAGQEIIVLQASSNGFGTVHTLGPNGRKLCTIGALENGFGTIEVLGPYDQPLAEMGVVISKVPAGVFVARRIDGSPIAYLGAAAGGSAGGLAVYGISGREMVALSRTSDYDGILTISDANGKEMCKLVGRSDGGGMTMFHGTGVPLFSVGPELRIGGGASCVYNTTGEKSACMIGEEHDGRQMWTKTDSSENSEVSPDVTSSGL